MSKRDEIIEATCQLLEAQGFHGTGLNQILAESEAPKGSLYHYFPGGKEELTAAAVERSGHAVAARIRQGLEPINDPAETIPEFIRKIAWGVEVSGFQAGGPLTMVAMETVTSSQHLNQTCRSAYQRLQGAFQERLEAGGLSAGRAAELAQFITAAIEGGIILSRTYHTGDPLRRVAEELGRVLKVETPSP
ncbi:MAG: TetR/AcrR family transcriptional regulator [Candidatus Promineifilaceae bacterium]|nr:TetR/AcrR family transcriptional regulator [Candidatus Promineifilaceae bacterium]